MLCKGDRHDRTDLSGRPYRPTHSCRRGNCSDNPDIFWLDEDQNKNRAIGGSSNPNLLLIEGLALPTTFSGLAHASHPGPLPLFLDQALTVLHLSDSVRRIRRTRTGYGVS